MIWCSLFRRCNYAQPSWGSWVELYKVSCFRPLHSDLLNLLNCMCITRLEFGNHIRLSFVLDPHLLHHIIIHPCHTTALPNSALLLLSTSTNATLSESIPPISSSHPSNKPQHLQSDISLVKGAKKNAQN